MTTAAITSAVLADKGFPIGEGALSEAITDMTLTVLRRNQPECSMAARAVPIVSREGMSTEVKMLV